MRSLLHGNGRQKRLRHCSIQIRGLLIFAYAGTMRLFSSASYIGAIRLDPMSVVKTTWASNASRISWCLIV